MPSRRFPGRLLLAPAITALLTVKGCAPQSTDYFPLGTEQTWQYRITRTIKGETHYQKLIVANLPALTGNDGAVYFPRRRLDGRAEWYQRDQKGLFRVDPATNERSQILPAGLKAGIRWQEPARIRFLEMGGTFSATFTERVQNSITLDYVIEDMDATVEMAAGTFKHCMRIRGSGSMFAGSLLESFLRIRFIKIEQTDWYAPGVGLVKRVRNEYTTPAEFSNEYIEELETVR
ncbi:MAG: hypothetical protein HYY48_01600 [Gammaproteobacteria bacterium]|nr:hypothetical protein [Gammaproteobacteria bacterium]